MHRFFNTTASRYSNDSSSHHLALVEVQRLEERRLRAEETLQRRVVLPQALHQGAQVAAVADVNQPLVLPVDGEDAVEHGHRQHLSVEEEEEEV